MLEHFSCQSLSVFAQSRLAETYLLVCHPLLWVAPLLGLEHPPAPDLKQIINLRSEFPLTFKTLLLQRTLKQGLQLAPLPATLQVDFTLGLDLAGNFRNFPCTAHCGYAVDLCFTLRA